MDKINTDIKSSVQNKIFLPRPFFFALFCMIAKYYQNETVEITRKLIIQPGCLFL
jgi:hypothetical protein